VKSKIGATELRQREEHGCPATLGATSAALWPLRPRSAAIVQSQDHPMTRTAIAEEKPGSRQFPETLSKPKHCTRSGECHDYHLYGQFFVAVAAVEQFSWQLDG
jgi:hypothetical protein